MAIVLLRLAIGWHFFREGSDKIISGNWSSVGFMKTAKGPFAPVFQSFVWDIDGRARLDKEATLNRWKQYREQVIAHYGFDETQSKRAAERYEFRKRQLNYLFDENAEDIATYFEGLARRDRYRQDAGRMEVTSLRQQVEQIERDLTKDAGGWLSAIDKMWSGYAQDLNALATPEQAARGGLSLELPARRPLDTKTIDKIIPVFDVIVGACLILGLFTRITSLAGAGFLASVVATQWPGSYGAIPTYYQSIEMLAMLVLAAIGAGRFAGLDFLIHMLRLRCCPPKRESAK